MMNSKQLITILVTFVMLATACAPTPGEPPTPVDTPEIPITGATATEVLTETESSTTEAPTETQALTETETPAETSTLGADADVTVMVSDQGGAVPFLVDDQGRSLYAYVNDSENSSTSACMDDCAVEWPPLVVTGMPVAGKGVDRALLATLARDDGLNQATYNGWPLYYSNQDTIPGSTYGQSYNGVWFLISPTGDPIQQ